MECKLRKMQKQRFDNMLRCVIVILKMAGDTGNGPICEKNSLVVFKALSPLCIK